jgi:CHAT domain-containing protein
VAAPVPVARALVRIGARRALLYFATERAVWIIAVANRRVLLHKLPAPPQEIQRLADLLLANPSDVEATESLGRILLPSAAAPPSGDLYVVAPGLLAGIPFAALRPDQRAAVERWTLHFVPSLSALAALSEATDQTAGPAVVLADAAGDLPGAREESIAVARTLGVEPLLGPRASREAVRGAGAARLLHLAVHGGVGLQGAWLDLGDGELTGADVLRWKLRPTVVVLTSCSSAAARAREFWGSMAASFLAAGSRAVVASLWSVEDAATRAFAERFYQEGGGGGHPARALARAQRSLLQRGVPPSSWAGFVVLGDAGQL